MRVPASRRPPRATRDLRGHITILVVVLGFGVAFAQLAAGREDGATVPPWVAQTIGVTLTGYFMTKGAEKHAEALRRSRGEKRESDGDG